jgi:hypothetical protein
VQFKNVCEVAVARFDARSFGSDICVEILLLLLLLLLPKLLWSDWIPMSIDNLHATFWLFAAFASTQLVENRGHVSAKLHQHSRYYHHHHQHQHHHHHHRHHHHRHHHKTT